VNGYKKLVFLTVERRAVESYIPHSRGLIATQNEMRFDMDDIETRVRSVIARIIPEVDPSSLKGSDHLIDNLGADSQNTFELVMAIEREFGIQISDVDAETFQTVQQIVNFVGANV
jgi:acyl carrier protein